MFHGPARPAWAGKHRPAARCGWLAIKAIRRAVEMFGGDALISELRLERNMSWAILYHAGEGTEGVQRVLIAANALAFRDPDRSVPTLPYLEERVS